MYSYLKTGLFSFRLHIDVKKRVIWKMQLTVENPPSNKSMVKSNLMRRHYELSLAVGELEFERTGTTSNESCPQSKNATNYDFLNSKMFSR